MERQHTKGLQCKGADGTALRHDLRPPGDGRFGCGDGCGDFPAPSMGVNHGAASFGSILKTLWEMDFTNKQLKPDAPRAEGGSVTCASKLGFSRKWADKLQGPGMYSK